VTENYLYLQISVFSINISHPSSGIPTSDREFTGSLDLSTPHEHFSYPSSRTPTIGWALIRSSCIGIQLKLRLRPRGKSFPFFSLILFLASCSSLVLLSGGI
jgi:hypothetical protein